ncbi:MAG: hypothetical protein ACI31G_03600 [Bacilli bacterium]
MKIEEKIYLIELYDIYSSLLSSTQKNMFHDYYLLDLSLQEIATNLNITRSGVEDALKKAKTKLLQLEDNLHVHKNNDEHQLLIKKINDANTLEEVKQIIKKHTK